MYVVHSHTIIHMRAINDELDVVTDSSARPMIYLKLKMCIISIADPQILIFNFDDFPKLENFPDDFILINVI